MKNVCRILGFLLTVFLILSSIPALYVFAGDAAIGYTYANTLVGDGEGCVSVSGLSGSGYYSLYFADDSGVFSGYEPIVAAAQKGSSASVALPRAFLLPAGATKIALFESTGKTPADLSLSAASAVYDIPAAKQLPDASPSLTFASVSDAHLNYDDNGYGASAKWTAALNFFDQMGMDCVVLSGDITGSGSVTEYERYAAATAASTYPAENIYEAQGNHDSTQVARFLSYTQGEDDVHPYAGSAWFYVLKEGENGARDNLFIFMAQELSSTSGTPTTDNFSTKQLNWVEGLLKTYSGTNTNIFLVEHAMIRNFGPGDKYNGVYVEPMYFYDQFPGNMRFKSLLTEYKEIIMMSGHTHLSLYEGYNFGDENGAAARMIHNSSTSQPRSYTSSGSISYNSEGRTTATAGSEGYLVYVYDEAACYVGYNLTTGKAIPTASYMIPLYSEDRSAAVSIAVTTPPTKTTYEGGEWFDGAGMVVTATYGDGTTAEVKGWGCSKVGALSAGDKSVQITYGDCAPVSVSISVGAGPSVNGEGVLQGSGTYSDPFLISSAEDFAELTKCFNASTSSASPCGSGYFYRQTADIDMTGYSGYEGTHANGNAKCYFGGVYDGGGHTLTVNISSTDQTSVFPYIYGTILNLKINGSISSSTSAQPVRTIQSGAVVANCLFDLTLTSSNANGVCYTNYGTVYNCYITGQATHATHSSNSGTYYNVYAYVTSASGSLLTTSAATNSNDLETVEQALADRDSTAAKSGISAMTANCPSLTAESLGEISVVNGSLTIAAGTVEERPTLSGSGTLPDPYLIGTPEEFKLFTDLFNASVSSSAAYGKGCFFKQTADIDMTGYSGYEGTHANGSAKCYFGGVYDGGGYTLKVDISSSGQTSIFPYITGAIVNLKFAGTISSGDSAQPVRTIQSGAVVGNCLFDVRLTSSNANGVCYTNYGTVFSCYVKGQATHVAYSSNSGYFYNVYAFVTSSSGSVLTSSAATNSSDYAAVARALCDRANSSVPKGIKALTALNAALTVDSLLPFYANGRAALFIRPDTVLADINADGDVDVSDVTTLLNILANANGFGVNRYYDINGDLDTDVGDVTKLLNILAGPVQPVQPTITLSDRDIALFNGSYNILNDRITDRGYAITSLTGTYVGMFTRDSSIQVWPTWRSATATQRARFCAICCPTTRRWD